MSLLRICRRTLCTSLESVGLVPIISPPPVADWRGGGLDCPSAIVVTGVVNGLGVMRDVSRVVVSIRVWVGSCGMGEPVLPG